MLNEIEHRAVELRAESEGVLSGILIPYGVPTGGRQGAVHAESVRAAGSKTLGSVKFGLNSTARSRNAPLCPSIDRGGGLVVDRWARHALRFEATPADYRTQPPGSDIRVLVSSEACCRGLSSEFRVRRDVWRGTVPGRRLEAEIHKARLRAIVDDPSHSECAIPNPR